jgi:hypothetical protein
LCYNPHHYYCIVPYIYIYIERECWLTNRLSLLIILNSQQPNAKVVLQANL